jgi:hypothetical protein
VLGKIDESKKIVLEIRCVFPPGRPSSRTVFPTRCELIRKSRTLRKRTTSAVMCNSRFASNISSLARIFTGKMQKNLPKNGCHFGTHADSQPPRVAKSKPKELKLFFLVPLRNSSLIKDATLRGKSCLNTPTSGNHNFFI